MDIFPYIEFISELLSKETTTMVSTIRDVEL